MSEKEPAKVSKYTGKPYTKISFIPDFKRFNMENLEEDIYSLMKKRVYDTAAWTSKFVSVSFNGENWGVISLTTKYLSCVIFHQNR